MTGDMLGEDHDVQPLLELAALIPHDTPKFLIPGDTDGPAIETKAHSSLSVYTKNYSPRYRMRFSMLNLQYNCGMLSSPAPLAGWLDKWMALVSHRGQEKL